MENIGIDLKQLKVQDFESVKERVFLKLLNYDYNKKIIDSGPYVKVTDLVVTYGILLNMDDSGTMAMHVNHQIMESWGIDEGVLFEWAVKNTEVLLGIKISSLLDIFRAHLEKINEEKLDIKSSDDEMYVITNKNGFYGAAVMLIPGVLKDISKKIDSDLIVIPSSVHETIVFGADKHYSIAQLNELIKEVNSTLSAGEVLSDHAYFYHRGEDKLTLAT